ncbi:MAG: HU family DNA-binding protein [Candidatus Kapaibacterium sp.]
MNKSELIDAVAKSTDVTKAAAERAINSTIAEISKELKGGGDVRLIGFGTFSVAQRAARKGVNLQTGKPMKIAAKKVAKFKPGKALAESVNGKKK